jgi:small-conductance mechanosensitive channel
MNRRLPLAAAWVLLGGLCVALVWWTPWPVPVIVFLVAVVVAILLREPIANAANGLWLRRGAVLGTGHYIRLEGTDDIEGYVSHIGWRHTLLQTPTGDITRLPNTTLANSIFTNFHLVNGPDAVLVDLDADAAVEPRLVENAIQRETEALERATRGLRPGSRSIRTLPGRFPQCRRYVVSCRAIDPANRDEVRNELRSRIDRRLRREGIAVPILPQANKEQP